MYPHNFNDALAKQPLIKVSFEDYMPKNRVKHDIKEQLANMEDQLSDKENILYKIVKANLDY